MSIQAKVVPVANTVSEIYSGDISSQEERYLNLINKFQEIYGTKPQFIARSPGRVNVIGEHIDYCGMPVFPMAVEQDTLIAFNSKDGTAVNVANTNSKKYPSFVFEYSKENIVTIDPKIHAWSNYYKCGYKGALEKMKIDNPKGMDCLVDGDVPTGAGLSSSSSLVCTVVLATQKANGYELDKEQIVNTSVASERYTGVNGGGMDQTCSVMATRSSALFIEFHPFLKVTPVKFPSSEQKYAFVVANSLVVSDKHITAPVCYNLRVVETRIASLMLAQTLKLDQNSTVKEANPLTMKVVMDVLFANQDTSSMSEVDIWINRLNAMLAHTETIFGDHVDGYSWKECADYLHMSIEELKLKVRADLYPVRAEFLQIYKRTKHVFSETLRVVLFRQTCEEAKGSDVYPELGNLMNQSQDSCDKLFDCSCKELNELCQTARDNGSLGSRLTGAGWGGCTISLLPESKVESFIQSVKDSYYKKHFPSLSEEQLKNSIFATKPGSGMYIVNVKQ
ncbi:Galactokinase [Smittium mucronatum]|uniref:Galactokinase n=1 Tax=Smittium mucronatum TaxID=133383 RepID=A0A1R0GXM4_9FUNG|nr:Galactokinase [Smittium mucronatum]